jgi:hypothetical protein
LQNQELNNTTPLIRYIDNHIPLNVIERLNHLNYWTYGYHEKYDIIVISKTGQIGKIVEIQNLRIALPKEPTDIYKKSETKSEQKWSRIDYPSELSKVKTRNQWKAMPQLFKNKWASYIEAEFNRRDNGHWFMNKGIPTYITGSHYFYLQWASIDVGYPEYREANRIFWIFWEACKADERCFGMCYLKIRRSGFSYMASSETINLGTLSKDKHLGILSKTGKDAQRMFTGKVVPINSKLPFFYKPIMEGMDKPKTELSYAVPASKITKNNMYDSETGDTEGLDTVISWRNTDDNSYDSEKLYMLVEDESGKLLAPNNIEAGWRVRKTCLRLGVDIVGKCMMGSTCNALAKGGQGFKNIYNQSDVLNRNENGQTQSGLYSLFIPMEWNTEGFIDEYGFPVFYKSNNVVYNSKGKEIKKGAIEWWTNEVAGLKSNPDSLNEFYRQYPRTESHAFRDESKSAIFNLTKIYEQIDYNETLIINQHLTRGNFGWKDGIKDTVVEWHPNPKGRFLISWIPNSDLRNRFYVRNGIKYPANEHIGAFGCDPYDISGTVDGKGSKGSLHGLTMFHMEDAPTNEFFLEYIARPQTAEIFFEDVLMACVFYGMPLLAENNKARLLYHFKHRGYRGFSMNRPDKHANKLSKTEREIGGIPSSSEDVLQAHASAIESYIEKHVGVDINGKYRPQGEMGTMLFNNTLEDWASFDISKREKFDASISSGYAVMACQKHLYKQDIEKPKISIKFARYNNEGIMSTLILD